MSPERREPALEMGLEDRAVAGRRQMPPPQSTGRGSATGEKHLFGDCERRVPDPADPPPLSKANELVSGDAVGRRSNVDEIEQPAQREMRPRVCGEGQRVHRVGQSLDPVNTASAGHRRLEKLLGDRRRIPVGPFRLVVQLDHERRAWPPERSEMVDPGEDRRVAHLNEAGGEEGALGRRGVVGEQVDVAERTQPRFRVAERDLVSLHQDEPAVEGFTGCPQQRLRAARGRNGAELLLCSIGYRLAEAPQPTDLEGLEPVSAQIGERRRLRGELLDPAPQAVRAQGLRLREGTSGDGLEPPAEHRPSPLRRHPSRRVTSARRSHKARTETQRHLRLDEAEREIVREPQPRQQPRIRSGTERHEPGLALEMMERKRLPSVVRGHFEPFGVNDPNARERRMRGELVIEDAHQLRVNAGACENRVEGVLVREVRRIVRRSIADHRPTDVDMGLRFLQLLQHA